MQGVNKWVLSQTGAASFGRATWLARPGRLTAKVRLINTPVCLCAGWRWRVAMPDSSSHKVCLPEQGMLAPSPPPPPRPPPREQPRINKERFQFLIATNVRKDCNVVPGSHVRMLNACDGMSPAPDIYKRGCALSLPTCNKQLLSLPVSARASGVPSSGSRRPSSWPASALPVRRGRRVRVRPPSSLSLRGKLHVP